MACFGTLPGLQLAGGSGSIKKPLIWNNHYSQDLRVTVDAPVIRPERPSPVIRAFIWLPLPIIGGELKIGASAAAAETTPDILTQAGNF